MTSLVRVQREMQDFLLRGDASIETHVVGTGKVPLATRLGIYHHAYRVRLVEALCANYPALAKHLGAEQFAELGARYVDAWDSSSFSVRHYGSALATLMKTPFLSDLAQWEWTVADVFDAADATPVGVKAVAAVSPEQWGGLHFTFHPSVRRFSTRSNAVQVWKALTADEQAPSPNDEVEPTNWLLWRQDLRTMYRSLSVAEAQAIESALAGRSFGDLCSELCVHCTEDEAPARAAAFLRDWIESGLITEVGS